MSRVKRYVRLFYKFLIYWRSNGIKATLTRVMQKLRARWHARKMQKELEIRDFEGLKKHYSKKNRTEQHACLHKLSAYQHDSSPKVLLIVPSLDEFEGLSALNVLMRQFSEKGMLPLVFSCKGGAYLEQLSGQQIPVIVDPDVYKSGVLESIQDLFSLIVVNTLDCAPAIHHLFDARSGVMWWIHEQNVQQHAQNLTQLPRILPKGIHVFAGNEDVKQALDICFPYYKAEVFCGSQIDADVLIESYFEKHVRERREKPTCHAGAVYPGTVSVVIPTYNAGSDMERLLSALGQQEMIEKIEIIAVDSASRDDTVACCERYGVQVIQISQEEFSHSYARNLGAIHAQGDILVFMTQDALPLDNRWMYHLIMPIVEGKAAATTCREQCPEGTELYYRVASWYHTQFIGIEHEDRYNTMSGNERVDELRQKGSLSDVSTAIDAHVFRRYMYRHGFAEDLDMGLRLLKRGECVGLLSATATVHSHNRPAGYYVKRCFVETRSLEEIDLRWKAAPENEMAVADRILCAYEIICRAIARARDTMPERCSVQRCISVMEASLNEAADTCHGQDVDVSQEEDRVILRCLQAAKRVLGEKCASDRAIYGQVYTYMIAVLKDYLERNCHEDISREIQQGIYDCLMKQYSVCIGTALGTLPEDSDLFQELKDLGRGV